jgi:hypothetical protein
VPAREPDNRRRPAPPPGTGYDPRERFNVPGADILSQNTWADEPETCPACGLEVDSGQSRCTCGQWLERCNGSCPSCASPKCISGRRAP